MPHRVQVMAYTKFELLHEIFLMQLCSVCVKSHLICPVLLSNGQYLQSLLLQKLYPLVRVALVVVGVAVLDDATEVNEPLGLGAVAGLVIFVLRKLVIETCFNIATGVAINCVAAGGVVTARTWSGSAMTSPSLYSTLALTTKSRRFFDLRYPHMSFFSCMNEVVVLLPSISQFENTRFFRV